MKVKYDVEIPRISKMEERKPIENFISSSHKNIALEYDSYEEAAKRRNAIRTMCKREGWNLSVSLPQESKVIYINRKSEI